LKTKSVATDKRSTVRTSGLSDGRGWEQQAGVEGDGMAGVAGAGNN